MNRQFFPAMLSFVVCIGTSYALVAQPPTSTQDSPVKSKDTKEMTTTPSSTHKDKVNTYADEEDYDNDDSFALGQPNSTSSNDAMNSSPSSQSQGSSWNWGSTGGSGISSTGSAGNPVTGSTGSTGSSKASTTGSTSSTQNTGSKTNGMLSMSSDTMESTEEQPATPATGEDCSLKFGAEKESCLIRKLAEKKDVNSSGTSSTSSPKSK